MADPTRLPLLAADGTRIGWVSTSSVPACAVDYCAKCAACLECETEDGKFLNCWGADEQHVWAVQVSDLETFRREHDGVEVTYA